MAWARFGSVRLGDDASTDDWMGARDDEVARRQALEDAGYEAWAGSTASGENLQAPRPSDVAALGGVVLGADGADGGQDSASPPVGDMANDDRSQTAKTYTPATAVAPSIRYVKAKPGDSISSLLGTSDPGAVGRFATLNGMDGRSSNIYPGRVYALPTASHEPSQDEAALGGQLLQHDNARAAALANAANDQFSARLAAGRNVWTGTPDAEAGSTGLTVRPSSNDASLLARLNHSEVAKLLARQAALELGRGFGRVRGAANLARDTIDTIGLSTRLMNPLDFLLSPPGQSAQEQVTAQIHDGLKAMNEARRDPNGALKRAKDLASRAVTDLIPEATPEAATALGEAKRVLPVGANQGELEANVGALFVGGEAAEAIRAARAAASAVDAGKFAERYPEAVDYWSAPYRGRGSHFLSQNRGKFSYIGGVAAPGWLQKIDIPPLLRDLEILRLRPKEFTNAQMLTRHALVDPQLYGGRIPAQYGRGWSRRQLGLEGRLPPVGRLWYGASPQLKTAVGAGLIGGGTVDSYLRQWGLP